MEQHSKIYFTIFAGRKKYLEILKCYIDKLIAEKQIYEVHLWDYTKNPIDKKYLKHLEEHNPAYKCMIPDDKRKKRWASYYEYYQGTHIHDDDIVIKCDDDIVFIDLKTFPLFIKSISRKGLTFPNIVNNDVCALIQNMGGVHNINCNNSYPLTAVGKGHPMSRWFVCHEKAVEIHKLFLKNPEQFIRDSSEKLDPIYNYSSRISINLFGVYGSEARKYFKFINRASMDDETTIGKAAKDFNQANTIYTSHTIVHFAFGPQNHDKLSQLFLEQYKELANKL